MPSAPRAIPRLPVLFAVLGLALTGCAEAPVELPTDPPSPSDPPTATDAPIDEPEGVTTPEIPCDELVSPATIYAFNPNFVAIADWQPAPGSAAEEAIAAGGFACRWIHQSSGDVIDIAVAAYDEGALRDLKNRAFQESTMVPTYDVEGYFSVADGMGTAIAFDDPYRVVVESVAFAEPGEAADIMYDALQALAAG